MPREGKQIAQRHTASGTSRKGNISYCLLYTLEKEMVTHCSILAWKIPRTEEPDGLESIGLQRVRMTEGLTLLYFCTFIMHGVPGVGSWIEHLLLLTSCSQIFSSIRWSKPGVQLYLCARHCGAYVYLLHKDDPWGRHSTHFTDGCTEA